jgi:UDP-3-O-[3-hydroxymyristoyl] glucosamine N-acyltransferase
MAAQTGISGSSRLGRRVMLGGQVGLAGHLELGDGVRVGAKSGINHSIPAGQTVSGIPARPQKEWLQTMGVLPKLPELYRRLKRLEEKVNELSARLEKEPES